MSRVGKKPITIPTGVDVKINNDELEVKGPKGTLKNTRAVRRSVLKWKTAHWLPNAPTMI